MTTKERDMMAEESPHPMCDVCGLAPAAWGNERLLGASDLLCGDCFSLWYEDGVRDRAEMRKRRGVSQD